MSVGPIMSQVIGSGLNLIPTLGTATTPDKMIAFILAHDVHRLKVAEFLTLDVFVIIGSHKILLAPEAELSRRFNFFCNYLFGSLSRFFTHIF